MTTLGAAHRGGKFPGLDALDEALIDAIVADTFLDIRGGDVAVGADDEGHGDAAGKLGVAGEAFIVAPSDLVDVRADDFTDDVQVSLRCAAMFWAFSSSSRRCFQSKGIM